MWKNIIRNAHLNINTILVLLILIFCCCFYSIISYKVETYLFNKYDYIFTTIYDCLNNFWIAFLWIAICVFTISCYFYNEIKNRNFKQERFILIILGLTVLLNLGEEWSYPNCIILDVNLVQFSIFILLLVLTYDVCKLLYHSCHDDYILDNSVKHTFETDRPDIKDINSNRKSYADYLVEKIIDVNNYDSSFCIGISGNWGSGKTTFLNCIRKSLEKKDCAVADFNPWGYNNNEKITSDFFRVLIKTINPYNKYISEPILKYSEALSAIGVPSGIGIITSKILDKDNRDILSLKDEIIDILKNLRISFYIIIDDIDRMEADEILEVLKLIRNTADFPFLKYILAYDKNHVISQLRTKQIDESYLEKIISAEFILPRINNFASIKDHISEIANKMIGTDTKLKFIQKLTNEDMYLMQNTLHNFRGIRNFARVFAFNCVFIKKSFPEEDMLNMEDLFWIELLRIYDYKLYEMMRYNPNKIFRLKKTSENIQYYDLNENAKIDDTSKKIIQKLCNHKPNKSKFGNRFFYFEYYSNYFTLEIETYKLSKSEFNTLLKQDLHITDVLEHVFIYSIENKRLSLYRQILLHNNIISDISEAKSIINISLAFILIFNLDKSYIIDIMNVVFKKNKYKSELYDSLSKFMFEQIKFIINNMSFHSRVPLILSHMLPYNDKELDFYNEYDNPFLLDDTNCIILLKDNFNKSIMEHNFDTSDVFNESSELSNLILNSSYSYEDNGKTFYVQPIYKELIKWGKTHKSNNLDSFKNFNSIDFRDDDPNEYKEECCERYDEKIGLYFGSYANFNKFVKECFNKE